jgi:hypothetical protein
MTNEQTLSPDLLFGYTLNLEPLGRRRLKEILGGGATAIVFLGVDPEDEENQEKRVAIKVARAEERWREALCREWQSLRTLEEAERLRGTHYFPRALYPDPKEGKEEDLKLDLYWSRTWTSWLVLAQKLVISPGVHDLLLEYPDELRLPEPLALEIAYQYADMLTILHEANLTCADRKLTDLRWETRWEEPCSLLKLGDREALNRWQTERLTGDLMILDWNVTEQASPANIALDLFRFGILWYRMLLGAEPRFRREGQWQLEEPLEKHRFGRSLSFGTRRILRRLLHPEPESRYEKAQKLRDEIEKQITLWRQKSQDLCGLALKLEKIKEIEEALTAADVIRVRVEQWGEDKPSADFDKIHRRLIQALEKGLPFSARIGRWNEALEELTRFAEEYKYASDPAWELRTARYRCIMEVAHKTQSTFEEVESLFDQSDQIYRFDGGDEQENKGKLDLQEVERWRREAEEEQNEQWKKVRNRLWHEAVYRLELCEARVLKDQGDLEEALSHFEKVNEWREQLEVRHGQIVRLLDLLWGDPTSEQKTVQEIVEEGKKQVSLFESRLQYVFQDALPLQEAMNGLAAALRMDPGNPILAGTYHLLEVDRDYRRARESRSWLLEVLHWKQLREAWNSMEEKMEKASDDERFVRLKRAWRETLPELEERLKKRRDQISVCLEESRKKVQDAMERQLDPLQSLNEYKRQMLEVLQEAHRGQAVAVMLEEGERWSEELKPERVKEEMENKLRTFLE